VHPANDGSSDLLFGALNVSYLTNADIPGSTVAGGEIRGMTFLSTAGAYSITSSSTPSLSAGINIRAGGILTDSPNSQTFNAPISFDTRFGTTLTANAGGLRFNQLFSYSASGPHNCTMTGSGTITFAQYSGFPFGLAAGYDPIVKNGSGIVTFEGGLYSGAGTYTQNGGTTRITGNLPPAGGVNRSVFGTLNINSNSTFAISGGGKLTLNYRDDGIDLNSGSITVTGANSFLDASRDGYLPNSSGALVTTRIGNNGGSGTLAFSSQGVGTFDNMVIGNTGTGRFTMTGPSVVTASTNITLGLNANRTGTAAISGFNTQWNDIGDIVVANAGIATLEVRGGADLTTLRGHIGFAAGSNGTAIVSDASSTWTAHGSYFIGNGGHGNLQVLNGGVASTDGNSFLGFSGGSSGTATVDGAGSTWNTAGGLCVGGNFGAAGGSGLLAIGNGGAVNTATTVLYSTGEIHLDGAASLTGTLTSLGGLIRTFNETAINTPIVLGSGGLLVSNLTPGSNSTFSGEISGADALSKFGDGSLTLTGANTYSGVTTVYTGTLRVGSTIATSALVDVQGGTFEAAATQTINVLSVSAVGGAVVSQGVLTVGENGLTDPLQLTANGSDGGRIDLMTNALCIDYVPVDDGGATDAAELTSVRDVILIARNGGTWDGPGVFSSVAAADPATYAIGYALATQIDGIVGGEYLGNTSIDASSVLARGTFIGDANLDGTVNALDFNFLASDFGSSDAVWTGGDFNYDGQVDSLDFDALALNFNATLNTSPTSALGAVVPEPATLGVMLSTMLLPLRRRRAQRG
jgi:T5SS/PEP-CTERM-associated repeat protein/autotransporter-associated beta strand protein